MATRNQIATYIPRGALESAPDIPLEAVAPTPAQLAELSRVLQLLEASQGRPGVMSTVPDELAANLQTFMTLQAQEKGRLEESANNTLEVKFDEHDILGWAGSFFTWWQKLAPFTWQVPGAPDTLPARFRVALFGDWATGLYGAPVCAKSIQANGSYELVLHLGDTYYSGTDHEMTERLVKLWPQVSGAQNRMLNGNHEMYTGGRAYQKAFTTFGQPASYFAFENDHWILAGLDTAYNDHDLHGDQVTWLNQLAQSFPDKKLILFSHHQPYSLLDSQGPKLVAKLARLFSSKRIYAWYWGHEHHCILYEPHSLYGLRGRCIGHGGFPYFREKKLLGAQAPAAPTWKKIESKNLVPSARILDGGNPYVEDHPEDYGPNGYMTLEFDGPDLFEIVHDADGTTLWARPIE